MSRRPYFRLGCTSLHSISYKIVFLALVFSLLYGCRDKDGSDTIKPNQTPKNDFGSLISFETATSKSDLRFLAVDSLSRNLLMMFGKQGAKITKIGILEGTKLTIVETNEVNFYPLKYSILDGNVNVSLIFKKVDNQLPDLEVVNESTKKSDLTKGVELPKDAVAQLLNLRKIFDNDLKSARVSSVQCAVTNTALKYIMSMNCLFRAVAPTINKSVILIGSPESWPVVEKQLEKHCEQAFEPISGECRDYGADPADLLNSCFELYTKNGVLDPACIKDLPDDLMRRWNDFKKSRNSGAGVGDPHLMTFDGTPYDFQGHGEFIAVKSKTDNFEIQVRQEDAYKNGRVTMNTGIAIQTGSDVVCVTVKPYRVFVNKQVQDLANLTRLSLKDGASLTKSKEKGIDVLIISHKNGDVAKVVFQNTDYLDYYLYLSENRKNQVIGLLGNYDGDKNNDIQTRNGENLLNNGNLAFGKLYPGYADSWRITQSNSLFYYDSGKNTDTYTQKDFPRNAQTLTSDQKIKAEATCRAAGVTSEPFLSNCIVDVAITNNPDAAKSALFGQEFNNRPPATPVPIVFETVDVKTIEIFEERSFILKMDGTLWASGENQNGEFGNGQPVTYSTNNKFVKIMDGIKDIAKGEGFHMLFLKNDNTVWASGPNGSGQLGNGTASTNKTLTAIKIMSDAKALAIGRTFSLVLKNDNTLWSFGDNSSGSLGDGTTTSRNTPVKIMSDVSAISAGRDHALVLKTDHSVWGFGGNYYGALGVAKTISIVKTPQKIMDGAKSVSAGSYNSMIIKNDNTLWVAGRNNYGQLGNGSNTDLFEFKKVLDDVISAEGTFDCSHFIKTDNSLWGTGDNLSGNLGKDTNTAVNKPMQLQTNVRYVATGYGGTIIAKTDNTIWATGGNAGGQLGSGLNNGPYPWGSLSFFQINVK